MQDLFNFALKIVVATLFVYLLNVIFNLNIPYDITTILIIAFLGIPGLMIILFLLVIF